MYVWPTIAVVEGQYSTHLECGRWWVFFCSHGLEHLQEFKMILSQLYIFVWITFFKICKSFYHCMEFFFTWSRRSARTFFFLPCYLLEGHTLNWLKNLSTALFLSTEGEQKAQAFRGGYFICKYLLSKRSEACNWYGNILGHLKYGRCLLLKFVSRIFTIGSDSSAYLIYVNQ